MVTLGHYLGQDAEEEYLQTKMHSPVSEERCGVPRLISRLPILCGGPLLLDRRWLEDGLDTLDWVFGCVADVDGDPEAEDDDW